MSRCLSTICNLVANQPVAWRNDRINRTKQIIAKVGEYELTGMPHIAESENHALTIL
jgi:hypothetical protein